MTADSFSSFHEVKESFSTEPESVNSSHANALPSTSHVNSDNCVMVEYTKRTKKTLLESILENPTINNGVTWFICPFCNEATSEPNDLVSHFDQHFCSCACGFYFTSVEALNIHKQNCDKSKNGVKEKKAAQIKADTSAKSSDNQEDQKKQPPTVRQKWTPKICSQCGKQYRTNYKLQEHMRKHTGEKPFQCSICEKAFRSKIGLAQHFATHTGQFDYNCSTCGKGFQCKSYLIVHQRVRD